MEIRVRATGAVMFWNEFRELLLKQNPSELITVLPQAEEWVNAHGADIVFEGPQATDGTVYQYSMRQGVEQLDGKWYTKYILGPVFTDNEDATAAEQEAAYKAAKDADQAKAVRADRDQKLAATDWSQGKDIADSVSAKYTTYRQELRDVPAQAGFPWDVQWPTQPE